ncbi:uncharacterized protein MELLADRAFT_113670 [Melampsora larici-populina 98AG31]|uniref:Uncharacterized protein n=1 Tax=Melampsora larici-populina (strain 98AG31 / pathotype 3-4-7) TaxID=747676 RepID=F4SAP7_MELLP|nr:uncharacterized protein MELLADRAFT_113670 [Melampsora larici-populina 98AG31]EGF98282.1 hypothetical protein MELLADRAFT_113670 [Melampsora larici-populina 98AG31]
MASAPLIVLPAPAETQMLAHNGDRVELDKYVKGFPIPHGYKINIAHSSKDNCNICHYECHRGGKPSKPKPRTNVGNTTEPNQPPFTRVTRSIKIECPFRLTAQYDTTSKLWTLVHVCIGHNHGPIQPVPDLGNPPNPDLPTSDANKEVIAAQIPGATASPTMAIAGSFDQEELDLALRFLGQMDDNESEPNGTQHIQTITNEPIGAAHHSSDKENRVPELQEKEGNEETEAIEDAKGGANKNTTKSYIDFLLGPTPQNCSTPSRGCDVGHETEDCSLAVEIPIGHQGPQESQASNITITPPDTQCASPSTMINYSAPAQMKKRKRVKSKDLPANSEITAPRATRAGALRNSSAPSQSSRRISQKTSSFISSVWLICCCLDCFCKGPQSSCFELVSVTFYKGQLKLYLLFCSSVVV